MPAAALAKSWDNAIADVTTLSERYKDAADKAFGDDRYTRLLGSQHTVQDIKMHMCAILGRRMGHADRIGHLEPPQPPLDSDKHTLLDNYASLLSWIRAAQRFGSMSQHQRAKYWNLECVGNLSIPPRLWVDVPSEVFYEVDGTYLWVYGDIVPGFADRLKRAVLANPDVQTVGIGSGGGDVYEAIEAAFFVRAKGLRTQLTGDCVSACPLFFLGGVDRYVMRPFPLFGFHQVSSRGEAVPFDDPVYDDIAAFVGAMGGNVGMIIEEMHRHRPDGMGYATSAWACQASVATWYQGGGSRVC